MKFFIMFVMVALLAALCSAQPVDNSAPEQSDTSGALRFKRNAIIPGHCPPGYTERGSLCIPDEYANYTEPNSAPDQPDTSGALRFKRSGFLMNGICRPGYTKRGLYCIPDEDYGLY